MNRNDDSNSYLKSNNSSEVIESYLGERARQVIIARGRYVRVTYRKDNGESETVEGFVQAMDATELTIYRASWRKKIPKDRISALMILNHLSQRQSSRSNDDSYTWIITGFLDGVIQGLSLPRVRSRVHFLSSSGCVLLVRLLVR